MIEDKKELMFELSSNIDSDSNNWYEFGGYSFYRDGEYDYKVFNENGDDLGSFHIDNIEKDFIKKRVLKKIEKLSDPVKKSTIKKKPRKKKEYDIILNEFMGHLHSCQCIVDGCNNTDIEAHHVMGRQPYRYDILCVPLCVYHHRGSEYSWHEGNVKRFRKEYSKDILAKKSMEILLEWLDGIPSLPSNIDEGMLRFVAEKIIESEISTSQIVKSAMLEYREQSSCYDSY